MNETGCLVTSDLENPEVLHLFFSSAIALPYSLESLNLKVGNGRMKSNLLYEHIKF